MHTVLPCRALAARWTPRHSPQATLPQLPTLCSGASKVLLSAGGGWGDGGSQALLSCTLLPEAAALGCLRVLTHRCSSKLEI